MSNPKVYLGDSVYAEFDGHFVTLTTENGIEATNTIYLEPQVQIALVKFFESIIEADSSAYSRLQNLARGNPL